MVLRCSGEHVFDYCRNCVYFYGKQVVFFLLNASREPWNVGSVYTRNCIDKVIQILTVATAKHRVNMRGPSVLSIQMMRVDFGKYDDRLLLGSNYRTIFIEKISMEWEINSLKRIVDYLGDKVNRYIFCNDVEKSNVRIVMIERRSDDRLQVERHTIEDSLSFSACTQVSLTTTEREGSIRVLSSVIQDVIDLLSFLEQRKEKEEKGWRGWLMGSFNIESR